MKIFSDKRSYSGGCDPNRNGEIELWKYIQDCYNPKIVFDVGVEKSSHIVDARSNEETKVWLFEPCSLHHQDLMKKYADFKNVFLHKIGLGDVDNQILKIFPSSGSIFFRDKTVPLGKLGRETVDITCRTLDSFCLDESIERIDFMKIDVEGYELKVLQGSKRLLDRIDLIQLEFGGTYIDAGITLKEIFEILPGRHAYAIEKRGLNKVDFESAKQEKIFTNFLFSKNQLQNL